MRPCRSSQRVRIQTLAYFHVESSTRKAGAQAYRRNTGHDRRLTKNPASLDQADYHYYQGND